MRILFTTYPLYGHVNPMLPLALAARDAGHEVVVATGEDMTAHLGRQRLGTWTVGPSHAEIGATGPPSGRYFAISAERRAADLVPRAAAWRPDLVVCDEFELAGPVAARAVGVPFVVHGLGVMPPMPIWAELQPAIDLVHRRWGLPDGVDAVRAAVYLEAMPASLQPAGERMWSRTLPLRPVPGLPAAGERLPAAIDALPHADTIHLTMGTLFHETPGVLETAIEGLRALPLNLVVTCGPGVDPRSFGPQPAHVLIETYLPHALLLPRCRLVVSQGGAGIMLGALAHDLPQLMLPQGADQFINAEACTRDGVALALAPPELGSASVRAAAVRLLDDTRFTGAARRLGAEIRAMPGADEVARALPDLAAAVPSPI